MNEASDTKPLLNRPDVAGWGLLLVIAAVICGAFPRFGFIDDAYITFRYSQNLADGLGLVYNAGERVEGITNLLWSLILALAPAVGLSIPKAAFILGIVFFAVTVWRVYILGLSLKLSPRTAVVAPILLVLSLDFYRVSGNGLESALFAALLAEMLVQLVRSSAIGAFVAAGFLFATRPEGAAAGVILALVLIMTGHDRRRLITGIVCFGCIVGAITLFRSIYYGELIPNSIIAKGYPLVKTPGRVVAGLLYSARFLLWNGALVVPVLAVLAGYRSMRKRTSAPMPPEQVTRTRLGATALCIVAASWVVILRNGGDWMPSYRLLVQYAPAYAALAVVAISQRWLGRLGIALLLIWQIASAGIATAKQGGPGFFRADTTTTLFPFWFDAMDRLEGHLLHDDVISAEALGMIGFRFMSTRFHDPIGLIDRWIALHGVPQMTYGKIDPTYTLTRSGTTIALWHYAGHLSKVPAAVLSNWDIFCYGDCDNWRADIVMFRRDRRKSLAGVFADWTQVMITPDGLRPFMAK